MRRAPAAGAWPPCGRASPAAACVRVAIVCLRRRRSARLPACGRARGASMSTAASFWRARSGWSTCSITLAKCHSRKRSTRSSCLRVSTSSASSAAASLSFFARLPPPPPPCAPARLGRHGGGARCLATSMFATPHHDASHLLVGPGAEQLVQGGSGLVCTTRTPCPGRTCSGGRRRQRTTA